MSWGQNFIDAVASNFNTPKSVTGTSITVVVNGTNFLIGNNLAAKMYQAVRTLEASVLSSAMADNKAGLVNTAGQLVAGIGLIFAVSPALGAFASIAGGTAVAILVGATLEATYKEFFSPEAPHPTTPEQFTSPEYTPPSIWGDISKPDTNPGGTGDSSGAGGTGGTGDPSGAGGTGGTGDPSGAGGAGGAGDPSGAGGTGGTSGRGGWPPSQPSPPVDPLVLDLDGDGIELVAVKRSTTQFDFDGDGFAERTGWVAPDDGFLVWDKNRNGKVDGISELFGNQTTDGYIALRTLDSEGLS